MDVTLLDLPVVIIQTIAYLSGILSVVDIRSLCLTCKALNHTLHGEHDEFDLNQHRSLLGPQKCIKYRWPNAAKLALSRQKVDEGTLHECLMMAFDADFNQTILFLLRNPKVDPVDSDQTAISWAASKGYIDIVERLLEDPRVDPSQNSQESLLHACMMGHVEVVKRLLEDPRVDPSAESQRALFRACTCMQTDVVAVLLEDSRVDPNIAWCRYLHIAIRNGSVEIASMLIERLPPNIGSSDLWASEMLTRATHLGRLEIIPQLLNLPFVTCDVLNGLLTHRQLQPDRNHLVIACKSGYPEIVSLYLEDGRIDPSYHLIGLEAAAEAGFAEIVDLFYKDYVEIELESFIPILSGALIFGNKDVAAVMLKHMSGHELEPEFRIKGRRVLQLHKNLLYKIEGINRLLPNS